MTSEILDRMPPRNLDAEKALLGSVLLDPSRCDEVASILEPRDFYAHGHQKLFDHMVGMRQGGVALDVTLLVERLKQTGDLQAIGGIAYLAEVLHSVSVAAHAVYYAKLVAEKSRRRLMIQAATEMLQAAWDESASVESVLEECESKLQGISTGQYAGDPVSFQKALVDACVLVDDIVSRRKTAGLMTGLESFDFAAGGFFPGELIILAARPSVGKSAMALQIAEFVGGKARTVYFASLEMRATQLALRALCAASGVSVSRIRAALVGPADFADMSAAGTSLHGCRILLHDRPGLTVQDIRRACRHVQHVDSLSLVVVDYLQRVTPADHRANRYLQIGQITGDLKALAGELEVPVLCLCQLSRLAEERDKKSGLVREPQLSDLKESGDIEQDADMVLLLHRQQRESDTLLILRKNRQGEQARFRMSFDGRSMRFSCSPVAASEF